MATISNSGKERTSITPEKQGGLRYFECPTPYDGEWFSKSIFLAGGFKDCPDWQKQMAELLSNTDFDILNPRREVFDQTRPNNDEEQITWENEQMENARVILFWFCEDAVQPIALHELAAYKRTSKPIIVGVHPNYPRRRDIEIQLKIARPSVTVVNSLEELAQQAIDWFKPVPLDTPLIELSGWSEQCRQFLFLEDMHIDKRIKNGLEDPGRPTKTTVRDAVNFFGSLRFTRAAASNRNPNEISEIYNRLHAMNSFYST